jgi:DNA invertase Pin-like site-specific DNA recombinase
VATAYSYVRFSTPDQAKGDSLRRQLARSAAFTEARGLELDDSLRDLGTSAFHNRHADTGHLAGFLALVRDGKIEPGSYFLVESLDRLSRDEFWPAFDLIRDLLQAGIVIVTLPAGDDPREYSLASTNRNPALVNEIIYDLTRSHRESKIKSERCAEAAAQQRAAARTGKVKIPGRCPAWLKPIRREVDGKISTVGFDLLPGPAAAIRRVFELSIAGMGERALASRLNAEGVPGLTKDVGWHHSTVKQVLRSVAVIGTKQPGRMVNGKSTPDGAALEGYYPPVVDEGTFFRAAASRRARNQRAAGRKGRTVSNLISGLARCGECGSALLFIDKGNKTPTPSSVYLVCTAARRKFKCTNTTHHHYRPLEAAMLRALTLFDPSVLLDKPPTNVQRGADLEAEIAEKAARLRRLAEIGNLDEVEDIIRRLTSEVRELRKQLEEHKRNAKVAEAEAVRDAHADYCSLVERMNAGEMPDAEAYVLRSRIAQYLRRIADQVVTDGHDMILQLKTPTKPAELRFVRGAEVSYLPVWDLLRIDGFRSPAYHADEPYPYVEIAPA